MDLHSFSVNVDAAKQYFSLAEIFVWRAVQASRGDGCPALTLAPQASAF